MTEKMSQEIRSSASAAGTGIKTGIRLAKLAAKAGLKKVVIILAGVVIFCCLISGGLPETSFNSFSHHNEDQDPITVEDNDAEDLSDAVSAEAEGVDILANALSEEKIRIYDELEALCRKSGVSYEATLQFLDSDFAEIGSESFSSHASGTYTEEEYEACVFLSAYSVSVDNLWGESEGNGYGGAAGAVQWAIKIAADDSFSYGKSPAANHFGCYFCGNQGNKQRHAKKLGITRSYEKTYCCNPFVTAAYVHGAGDPYIKCNAKYGLGLKKAAKKKCGTGQYRNFEWLGHIPKSQLQPGDVLLTNGHAKMYIGGGKQVQASGGKTKHCWGASSIAVGRLSYSSDCEVMRYKGGGYVTGNGVNGALKWAKKIADDNSYVYVNGYGKCHTCNGGRKAYVCTTFVKAAFAHGAGDSEMQKWCKSNKYGMVSDLHRAMKKSKNWKSLGAVSQKNMKKGDVIVWGNSHVEIYYGGGKRIGAHHMFANRADDISVKAMYGGYTDVLRYTGRGSGAGSKTYSKYKTIKTINRSDVKVAAKVRGTGSATTPQSMAYMGGSTFAVAYSNTTGGDTVQYIKKFTGSRNVKSRQMSLGHANGLCYNSRNGTLYSVRGYGSRTAVKINGKTLKKTGTKTLPTGTSGIAYDEATGGYYLSSGSRIQVTDGSFAKKKSISKIGAWRYAQDVGGRNGIIYSAVSVNKSSDNRIGIYDASTGKYYGSYKLGWSGIEIEDCEVDSSGHLLILVNVRGSNTDYIYRTKESLAVGVSEGGGYSMPSAELKEERGLTSSIEAPDLGAVSMYDNWRVDMYIRLQEYLQEFSYYDLKYDEDENGNPIKYEGVIDEDEDIASDVDDYREDTDDNIIDDLIDEDEISDEYDRFRESNSQADDKKAAKSKKPSLSKEQYIKVKLHKKDVFAFAGGAFGITKEDAEDLYGKGIGRDDALADMAMDSLALLHDIDDFEAQKVSEEGNTEYTISDEPIGKFTVKNYCLCSDEKCRAGRLELFGKTRLSSINRKAGVTCAADPAVLPVGTVIHSKEYGILVVEESLKRGSGNVIAIYTGNKSSSSSECEKKLKKKSGTTSLYLVTGLTQAEAKALGGGDGTATGKWVWPVRCSVITSAYGNRICPFHGREFHAAYDIGASSGTTVYAADGGTVIAAGYNGGYGNSITISHGNGISTMYNHMSKISVKRGQKVSRAQVIGKVGSTGSSTGSHLDFRAYVNGNAVDPFRYYPGVTVKNASSWLKKYYP